MTNLKDRDDAQAYGQLEHVEYLELLCRTARVHWIQKHGEAAPVHEAVFALLKMVWEHRAACHLNTEPVAPQSSNAKDQRGKKEDE